MDIGSVFNILVPAAFTIVGIALIVFIVVLIKMLKNVNTMITDLKKQVDPMMENVKVMTDEIVPVVSKIDPMMDRLQLTVDSVNLEMMRVDGILEDVSDITSAASAATTAVDNITNAPIKAVSGVAARVKDALGGKSASHESEQLAEQRVAVAKALEDYKAAEGKKAPTQDEQAGKAETQPAAANTEVPQVAAATSQPAGEKPSEPAATEQDQSYKEIDPRVIAESSFFDGEPETK